MNICGIEYASEVNEIAEAGLRTAPSVKVRPPRLAECPVQMECKLHQIVPLGRMPYQMVIGEVVYLHYRKGLVNERKHVNVARLNPLGRLAGYDGYTRVTDRFPMPRLPVPPGKKSA
jgi:flavin reductase (DIM6/NTAB) family NADH-FMN oxidoreductase RutF